MFSLLRAPSRFALVVAFALSVLAGVAMSALLRARPPVRRCVAAMLAARRGDGADRAVDLPDVPPVEPVYRVLATLPRGAVIEMPFFYPAVGLYQHTKYMLASTTHWMPLVNGYSDYIPPDFSEHVDDARAVSEPSRRSRFSSRTDVRYAVFHMYGYNDENRRDVLARLEEFATYLRPLYEDRSHGCTRSSVPALSMRRLTVSVSAVRNGGGAGL